MPTLTLCLIPFLAPTSVAPVQEEASTSEVFTITSGSAAEFLVDSKDRGLLDVVRLIGTRLEEMPEEFDEFDLPPGAAGLIARLIEGPCSLTVHGTQAEGEFPVLARLDLPEGDAAAARDLTGDVVDMLVAMGMEVERPAEGGMSALPAPIPVYLGDAGERCVLTVGSPEGPSGPVRPAAVALPGGVNPVVTMSLDYGSMLNFAMPWMASAGESAELEQMQAMFDSMGLTNLKFESAWGIGEDRSVGTIRMPGYASSMMDWGYLPEGGLNPNALRAVPEDARWAQVSAIDMPSYVDMMLEMMGPQIAQAGVEDPIEMLDEMTGFHLYRDILDHLGNSWGMYQSDTTGGAGLLSIVMFAELSDAAAIDQTCDRLVETLNGMIAQQTEGYVQMRHWTNQDVKYTTMTCPGIPVPLELTTAIAGNWWILAASPQAALGAAHQVLYATRSLVDNPRFQQQAPADKEGVVSVGFVDLPYYLRSGYMPAGLVCSAMANSVRSRADAGRNPGLVLPPFHELARDARASVTVGYVRGEDWVQHSYSDRSFMVNMVGLAGYVMEGPLLPIFFGAAGLGARAEAAAKQAQAWKQLEPTPHAEEEDY